jgi:hypothetical protein
MISGAQDIRYGEGWPEQYILSFIQQNTTGIKVLLLLKLSCIAAAGIYLSAGSSRSEKYRHTRKLSPCAAAP